MPLTDAERAAGVVFVARNPVHAALSLVATLFGIAVLFLNQNAQLLAAVQVIVYTGAIVVLILFVLMLLGVDKEEDLYDEPLLGQRTFGLIIAIAIFAIVFGVFIIGGSRVVTGQPNCVEGKVIISGNSRTRDEVIRREIRQLEDAWYDSTRIDRSKVRITRLQFFEDVNLETPSVPGSPDQVDVNITVTEKSTGNLLVGIGYSSADKLVVSGSVSQNNVFGTGNSLTASVNSSKALRAPRSLKLPVRCR